MTTFPKLYKINNKKIYEWSVVLDIKEKTIDVNTTYGYVGGSLIVKTKTIENGKAGRSLLEQAILEAKSKWNDKKEKELYIETLPIENERSILFRPMLAQTFNLNKKYNFPLFIQRKYDGIRCIAKYNKPTDKIILESRNGVSFPLFDLLKTQLKVIFMKFPMVYFDGELYSNEIPFEILSGLIRSKTDAELDKINKIQYHIYDYYNTENPLETNKERLNNLNFIINDTIEDLHLIKRVKTEEVNTIDDIRKFHDKFTEEGFEGIIIRFPEGIYEIDKRSKYLQKYKEFLEEEFIIVGFHQGDGGEKGCIIWDCKTKEEHPFSVRPRGTFEQRKEWYIKGNNYIGKYITVIFQEYSQDGIPRFPVGKSIRDDY